MHAVHRYRALLKACTVRVSAEGIFQRASFLLLGLAAPLMHLPVAAGSSHRPQGEGVPARPQAFSEPPKCFLESIQNHTYFGLDAGETI